MTVNYLRLPDSDPVQQMLDMLDNQAHKDVTLTAGESLKFIMTHGEKPHPAHPQPANWIEPEVDTTRVSTGLTSEQMEVWQWTLHQHKQNKSVGTLFTGIPPKWSPTGKDVPDVEH